MRKSTPYLRVAICGAAVALLALVGSGSSSFAPLQPNFKFYFGNLHSHTSFSDGSGTPREAYRYARETGELDFLAITEHNHKAAGPTSGDRADGKLIATDPTLYPRLITDANEATEDGQFVAIFAQEFSTISKGNHTNAFMARKVINTANGNYRTVFTDGWMNDFGVEVIQLNHPWDGKNANGKKQRPADVGTNIDTNYGFNTFPSRAAFLAALDGRATLIEVVNGPGLTDPEEDQVYFGTVKPAFYVAYLNLGLHLAPTANQDNHYRTWGTLTEARTVVLARELTRSAILQAMKERRVYATEDKDLKILFTVNGQPMGSILPRLQGGAAQIRVGASDQDEPASRYRVTIFYDTGPGGPQAQQIAVRDLNNNATVTVTHAPVGGRGYYFVVVTSTSDANEGYSAWTAPIWFE